MEGLLDKSLSVVMEKRLQSWSLQLEWWDSTRSLTQTIDLFFSIWMQSSFSEEFWRTIQIRNQGHSLQNTRSTQQYRSGRWGICHIALKQSITCLKKQMKKSVGRNWRQMWEKLDAEIGMIFQELRNHFVFRQDHQANGPQHRPGQEQ